MISIESIITRIFVENDVDFARNIFLKGLENNRLWSADFIAHDGTEQTKDLAAVMSVLIGGGKIDPQEIIHGTLLPVLVNLEQHGIEGIEPGDVNFLRELVAVAQEVEQG